MLGIIPGLNTTLQPLLSIKILQRMILLGSEAEQPVAGRTGRNMRLIYTADGEAVTGLTVHGAAGFLVLIVEGTAMLINHDAVLFERTEAVTVEFLGKQARCMT